MINRVVYAGERVVVTRHGKPLVALVSAADLERLEALAEEDAGEAEEQAVRTVSTFGDAAAAPGAGERGRFGIAAEHRPGGAPPGR
ncbi:type II toxin-antitoxin system prevent-host-death family antitoxin [Streptomyces sp. NPDC046887]|uniref:type II toxin-antitoxin system prevent-host-death family antitoxin n=1 Tax=Streptomyces sp. NPDC046887 TaxID=3155472 RepID=UPI003408BE0C